MGAFISMGVGCYPPESKEEEREETKERAFQSLLPKTIIIK